MFKLLSQVLPAPIPCPAGYYQGSDGQSSCDATVAGYYSNGTITDQTGSTEAAVSRFHVQQEHINLLLLKAPATSQMLDTSLKDQQEVMEFPTQ